MVANKLICMLYLVHYTKTVCMHLPSKGNCTLISPLISLNLQRLSFVPKFKYLGSYITQDNSDDEIMRRPRGNCYATSNEIIKKFYACSPVVKCDLFKAFCCTVVPALGDPRRERPPDVYGHVIKVPTHLNVKLPAIGGHLPNAEADSHLLVVRTCYNGQCKQMPRFRWSIQPKIARGAHPNLRPTVCSNVHAAIW